MGFIQKDALRTLIISYVGLILGYVNKGVLFVLILSTEQIGLVNLILSVGILFSQLTNLGTINSISKFLPFFKDNEYKKQSFLFHSLFIVLGGIILFTVITILLKDEISHFYSDKSALFVDYYYWIIPIGISNVLFLIFETYLRSIYKNIISVIVFEFLLRILVTILLVFLAFDIINFEVFFIIHGIIYFIPSLILFIYLIKSNEINFKRAPQKLSQKIKKIVFYYNLYSYSNTLGVMVVMTMDALMIAYFLGLKATGIYTTVIYLTNALQLPFKSLMRVSNPLVPQYWKEKNKTKLMHLYAKTSSISLVISLFIFLVIWLNIETIFSFLPKEYHEGIWVFLFLMIGRLVDMYFGLNGWILATSKKYKYDIIFTIVLIGLVFNLNLWLIPIYGITGAAISTSIAMIIYNIARVLFLQIVYKIHPFEKNQMYIILLFLVILLAPLLLPSIEMNAFLVITVKTLLISVLFLGIIISTKLNDDLNHYLENILSKVFKRTIKLSKK